MKTTTVMIALLASLTASAQSVMDESVSKGGAISLEARNIGIRCESVDKQVVIQGYIPKDTSEGELTVKIEGESHRLQQNEKMGRSGTSIQSVEDVLNGVFTVSVADKDLSENRYEVTLSSIPKTMIGKYKNGSYQVSFNAKFSFFKGNKSSSCEDGCIVMPIEVENKSKSTFRTTEVNCLVAYR
jgi:hypothetical protein